MRLRPGRSVALGHRHDLVAAVETAGRARAMGDRRLAAVLARHQVRRGDLVVIGSAHIALGATGSSLGDGHVRSPSGTDGNEEADGADGAEQSVRKTAGDAQEPFFLARGAGDLSVPEPELP